MQRFINTTVELAASGIELTAVYVTGAASIAPICKLCLLLAPVIYSLVRSMFTPQNEKETIHG